MRILVFLVVHVLFSGRIRGIDLFQPVDREITKHAVLIGVGNYAPHTQWNTLSAKNDVTLMSNAIASHGFAKKNIYTLTEEAFNEENLVELIEETLLNQVKEGDIVVFYYSGHGQQIVDDNGDEIDGLDEALVPFDSPRIFQKKGYKGQKLVRDDVLNQLFFQIQEQLGEQGHLLVLIDACHSGTSTRGIGNARGTDEVMRKKSKTKARKNKRKQIFLTKKNENKAKLASINAIYSSSAHQLSYEYQAQDSQTYGLMTYAFVNALQKMDDHATYQDLLWQIQHFTRRHNHLQLPMLEGEQQRRVFGGAIRPSLNLIRAKEYLTPTSYLIEAGLIHGIYPNSILNIYSSEVRDTTDLVPLAQVRVKHSEALWAEVESALPFDKAVILKSQFILFKRNHAFGTSHLAIDKELYNSKKTTTLIGDLEEHKYINFNDTHPSLFLKRHKNKQIQLVNDEGLILLKGRALNSKSVALECLRDIYAHYWKTLEQSDNRFRGTVEIEQISVAKTNAPFCIGDEVRLRIRNEGTNGFFFQLIGIKADNMVYTIPFKNRSLQQLYLKPKEEFISDSFTITPPIGTDFIKLIATPDIATIPLAYFEGEAMRGGLSKFRIGTAGIATLFYTIQK